MRWPLLGSTLVVYLFFGAVTVSADPRPVTIGAFNIQIFGEKKVSEPNLLSVLAHIATNYDLLAIEEVGSNGSAASDETCNDVLTKYVQAINSVAGQGAYAFVRGNQYGIIFRTGEFEVTKASLYQGAETFAYTPLTAFVRSREGKLTFSVIVIHTSPKLARSEIPALKTAMAEMATENGDPDVVAMGDFNGDGAYYPEGKGKVLAGFAEGQYVTAITNDMDSTVASSSNTYDRIEMTQTMAEDFEGEAGVLDHTKTLDVGTVEGTAKTAGTASAVSDHWPVWAKLWVDRDTN